MHLRKFFFIIVFTGLALPYAGVSVLAFQATPPATNITAASMPGANAARTGEEPGPPPKSLDNLSGYNMILDCSNNAVIAANRVVYGGTDAFHAWVGTGESMYTADQESTLPEIWRYPLDGESAITPPTLADGKVLFGTYFGGRLYALDMKSGQLIWKVQTGAALVGRDPSVGAPAVDNGRAFFGARDGVLRAVDMQDGKLMWSFRTNGEADLPASIANGMVFIGSTGYEAADVPAIYAVDEATGKEKWRFDVPQGKHSSAPSATVSTAISVIGDSVFFADINNIYALDASSGTERWHYRPDEVDLDFTGLAVTSDTVYGARNGVLHAIDIATGMPRWMFSTGFAATGSAPVFVDGTIYFGTTGGIYAVDAERGMGRVIWDYADGYGTPWIIDERLYICGDRGLWVL